MIQAFFLALGQLFDPRVARVFLKSLLLTLTLFAVLAVAMWFALEWGIAALGAWGSGYAPQGNGVLEWILAQFAALFAALASDSGAALAITVVLMLVLHWLLFRIIAIAVIGVFGDDVVEAVETRHYPERHAQVRQVPFARSLGMGLRSAGRAVLFNIAFSPVYLIANVFAPIVFFLVNAWLLGRDLGDMVAVRHIPEGELRAWRRRTRFTRLGIGAVGTGMLLIPFVNLLAPVMGAAMAAHAFHRGKHK